MRTTVINFNKNSLDFLKFELFFFDFLHKLRIRNRLKKPGKIGPAVTQPTINTKECL